MQKAFLYLGRANAQENNGHLIIKMKIDDMAGTVRDDLLAGTAVITINDADASWSVSRSLATCAERRPFDVKCVPDAYTRATFKRDKKVPTKWNIRIYALRLTNAETGPREPFNPIEPPVYVTFNHGSEVSLSLTNECAPIRNESLRCRTH